MSRGVKINCSEISDARGARRNKSATSYKYHSRGRGLQRPSTARSYFFLYNPHAFVFFHLFESLLVFYSIFLSFIHTCLDLLLSFFHTSLSWPILSFFHIIHTRYSSLVSSFLLFAFCFCFYFVLFAASPISMVFACSRILVSCCCCYCCC